jgi:hypothetical protein
MTLRAIARSRARTRTQGQVALQRGAQTPRRGARPRIIRIEDDFELDVDHDPYIAVDCRPSRFW